MNDDDPADNPADYPGAEAPARRYDIDSEGVAIAVHEWGDDDAPVMVLAHGGLDFARTFSVIAPMLADGGWRIVSWDHRGHGDSGNAHLYSLDADLRDAVTVFEHVAGREPVAVIGHSKSGRMMIDLADVNPFRFRGLINIDGIPWKHPAPDVSEHERSQSLANDVAALLDHRRRTATAERWPGTIDELAARRGRMNPRLSEAWLRYLVTVGAYESADGWRWKLDPSIRRGGFGPWRPEWTLQRLAGLAVPFLGVLVECEEEMGWRTQRRHVEPWLPVGGRVELLEGVGHFPHIEQPAVVAQLALDFFGDPT